MTARKARKKTTRKKIARNRQAGAPRSTKRPRRRRKPSGDEPDLGGRPAIVWDEEAAQDVADLAEVGNTVADIAAILGVSKRSLETAIAKDPLVAPAYERACAQRRANLRTAQHRAARRGNATMMIWLGKQELGQRDYKRLEVVGADGGPVELGGDVGVIVKQRLGEFLRSRRKVRKPAPSQEVSE